MNARLLATLAAFTPTPVANEVYYQRLTHLHAHAERRDGVVLFADISGFTAITEALMVESRQSDQNGSEELSALLNRYLTRMIDLLEDHHGQIVKLSGDAIMVLFPLETSSRAPNAAATSLRHLASQATVAAIQMQQAMQEFTHLPTSVGVVGLGLKIGIGIGQVLECHVGGQRQRWEYVIVGDAVVQAVQAQEAAASGMVVLSPQVAALIDPSTSPGQSSVIWSNNYQPDLAALDLEPVVLRREQTGAASPLFDWDALEPEQLATSATVLRGYIPAAITSRLEVDVAVWLAELRRMTILFVGVQGLDYADENASDQLQRILTEVQTITYRYEGSLNKVLYDDKGTVILLLFGAPPLAHEDDPQRALSCAFEIQQLAQQWERETVSIGIATDTVFAGPMGSPTRREYTVMGDAVNLAARLMQMASGGEILCSHQTFLDTRGAWNLEPLPQLKVKGKMEVVRPYRFAGERLRSAVQDTHPLMGRDAELATLADALARVERGRGQIISVVGEGGVGKTRLMNEAITLMRERGNPAATLRGVAESIGQQTPYLVWREVLTDYFSLLNVRSQEQRANKVAERVLAIDPDLEPRLPLLNDVLGLELPETTLSRSLGPRQRRDSLAFLIVQLLLAYTQGNVLLLLLDDMQWADSLSWELVVDVARVVGLRPVLLLLGYRPLEQAVAVSSGEYQRSSAIQDLYGMPMHQTLELLPLPPAAMADMAATMLDGFPLAPDVLQWLAERGQGNPLFIEETVKMMREQETVVFNERLQHWQFTSSTRLNAVPPTLKGVIQTRLDRLDPGTLFTCKVASVIGRIFSERVLQDIYPLDEDRDRLPERLDLLARLDITPYETLVPERRYQFKSALMQEVAYTSLLHAQRQALHQAVAEWYEREHAEDLDAIAPLLADHYGATEQWRRFLFFAERAGQLAMRRYAHSEALSYFSQAVDVLRRESQIMSSAEYQRRLFFLLLQRAEVYEHANAYARQLMDLRELEQLATEAGEERWQALVQLTWARYYQNRNQYDASEHAATNALRIAQRLNDWQLSGQSMNLLAQAAALRGDYRRALDWALQAFTDARLASDQQAEANALDFLGLAHSQLGEYSRADKYHQQALYLRRLSGDRWGEADTLSQLGMLTEKLGQPRTALTHHQEALAIQRGIGNRRGETESLRSIGAAYQALGDLGVAQHFFYEALKIAEAIGNTYGEAVLLNSLSGISTELADFEAARTYAERSLSLAQRTGNRQVEAEALDLLGNAYRGLGDFEQAYTLHAQAYRIARELELRRREAYAVHHLGEWEWHHTNYRAAADYWDAAAAIRQTIGEETFANASRARQAYALALLGDHAAARQVAEHVWDSWGIAPPPGEDEDELREGYLALYETWLQLAEPERADTALAWAYQAVQDRAVRISDPQIRQAFLQYVEINANIIAAWQKLVAEP